jgi:hypothetical protein
LELEEQNHQHLHQQHLLDMELLLPLVQYQHQEVEQHQQVELVDLEDLVLEFVVVLVYQFLEEQVMQEAFHHQKEIQEDHQLLTVVQVEEELEEQEQMQDLGQDQEYQEDQEHQQHQYSEQHHNHSTDQHQEFMQEVEQEVEQLEEVVEVQVEEDQQVHLEQLIQEVEEEWHIVLLLMQVMEDQE